ncbi:MAG: DUF5723 family protein [Polaribacter sp.]
MKKYIFLLSCFLSFIIQSQNKQIQYGFAELPQTLLLNPGAENNYKYHIGVPLLSGFSAELGTTGFTVKDLFQNDNRTINQKVATVLNQVNTRDYIKFNSQIEIFNAGFRFNDDIYFSFGFYEEIDGIGYFARDPITLINEGNAAYIGRTFSLSQINYKLDVLGVLHFGVSKKINKKLTLGARFKVYSSALSLQSTNNKGGFTTTLGTNNIYSHYLEDLDVDLKTSGLVDSDSNEFIRDASTYLGNTFFGDNLGVGLDFGLTYKINSQLEFTASILDFGFINHNTNVKNSTIKGTYTFQGVEFDYDNNNPDYWNELDIDFRDKVPVKENTNGYTSWRPTKFNAAIKYNFGEIRSKYCYDNTFKEYYKSAVGAQLYSVFRPLGPQLALTGFYEHRFSQKLQAKVTYTVDEYSFYNIGAGLSTQIGKVNFYGMIDNIAQFNDIANSNNVSIQLGINLIFN